MTDRSQPTRFLAFDIVHAVEFSRIGRTRLQALSAVAPGNFSTLHTCYPAVKSCVSRHSEGAQHTTEPRHSIDRIARWEDLYLRRRSTLLQEK